MLVPADRHGAVEAPQDHLVMRPLVQAADTEELSVTHVRLSGAHRPLRSDRSTRVYYVLEGAAEFTVGDGAPFVARAGDAVVVPRATRYALHGELAYLVVNAPAYRPGDDLYGDA